MQQPGHQELQLLVLHQVPQHRAVTHLHAAARRCLDDVSFQVMKQHLSVFLEATNLSVSQLEDLDGMPSCRMQAGHSIAYCCSIGLLQTCMQMLAGQDEQGCKTSMKV